MLPLFPLSLVLLPGELVPLHIFEERYKRLVAECRDTGDPFGVVLQGEDSLASTGCTARLAAVVDEFPDGRLNIVVRGDTRFRVIELRSPADPEEEPLAATVEYLVDVEGYVSAALTQEVEELFARVLVLADSDQTPPSLGETPFSFVVAGMLELELPVKQRLLQLDDESERLEVVVDALRALVPRLEVWHSREEAIRGNGKGI